MEYSEDESFRGSRVYGSWNKKDCLVPKPRKFKSQNKGNIQPITIHSEIFDFVIHLLRQITELRHSPSSGTNDVPPATRVYLLFHNNFIYWVFDTDFGSELESYLTCDVSKMPQKFCQNVFVNLFLFCDLNNKDINASSAPGRRSSFWFTSMSYAPFRSWAFISWVIPDVASGSELCE